MGDKLISFVKKDEHIFIAENFLTESEVDSYIEISEMEGFKPADVDIHGNRQIISTIRDNDRVDLQSTEIADLLWGRIDQSSLPLVGNMSACGLTPYLRFYRYKGDQKFQFHKDGSKEYQGKRSYYTLLIYLNDLPDSGATCFRASRWHIYPEKGKALLFKHDIMHAGLPAFDATKYVIRADMLFA
jgi:2OG-Fe(II) oxygenase superfamily